MRINVYSEEIGEGYEVVSQTSRNGETFLRERGYILVS